ncbi:MAG: hypothetical protein UY81_C0011G0011 [Candidatus Giovannonibacteria bacterium GW2011_GWA2_53_7]|uniref:Uncharacterized protein n=1 Tax=Candidatus Giovannonibacteria bacterium GW2011_GWA2_53_7 TaxID=1618650 RepID=A0A0G1Y0V7_9BACT|nr:MAG: hypothetical protein UY81_C0011G0011 [Candidatus Giovannonibacteria bacterium GW2011_GWA2_53_7]
MQKGQEVSGFGRGRSIDQSKRFREEMQEAEVERTGEAREVLEIEGGVRQLEVAIGTINEDDRGRDWAVTYAPIVENVDQKFLADIRFWEQVFTRFESEISPVGMFAALPSQIQADVEIQQFFFSRPHFNTAYLPRAVMEKVEPELIVDRWISLGVDEHTFTHAPWKHFHREQKCKFVNDAIKNNLSIAVVDAHRNEFRDAVPPDEWNQIARGHYTQDPLSVLRVVQDDLDRLLELFAKQEIRRILEQPQPHEEREAYLRLSLPILRALEFSEEAVRVWKEGIEESAYLASGFGGFEKMTPDDRAWVISLIPKRADGYDEGYQDFIRRNLPKLIQQLPPSAVSRNLSDLGSMFQPWELPAKDVADGIIRPTLENQGASAFRTFQLFSNWIDCFDAGSIKYLDLICPDKDSAKILRQIMNKTGARFQDFMSFYTDVRFGKGRDGELKGPVPQLVREENLIPYIDAKLPWSPTLFSEFEEHIASGRSTKDVAREMTQEVTQQVKDIQEGEWPEGGLDDYKLGLLSHVFPPALGVSREEYARLVRRREDRQSDVPFEWTSFQGEEISFPLGKWELVEGEQFEIAPWNRLSEVIAEVNSKKVVAEDKEQAEPNEILMGPSQVVEVGRAMVRILSESSTTSTKTALRDGYALFVGRGGAKLPEFVSGQEDATRLFEWSKDSLRDIVDVALRAYQQVDPALFEQEVAQATRREITPKAKKSIIKSVVGLLKNPRLADEQKGERIRAVLKDAGVKFEGDVYEQVRLSVTNIRDDVVLEKATATVVDQLLAGSKGMSSEAGKISLVIVQKILGVDGSAMEKEMDKWSFVEGAEGGEQRQIQFQITKHKLHAIAGLNMGVCVAVDDQLWNKEEFSNVVLFGDDGVARGGMHFEIVRDGSKTFLSLPGINPSLTMLREVSGERLMQAMLEYAKKCAKAIGAVAVLIPTNTIIFSNREELHRVIRDMKLPIKSLTQPHQFSYAPFAYSWQDGYEVAVE